VHLVRNAVDHGVETAKQRAERGKGQAILAFSARLSGAEVCIEVEDDGAGIDWERVRSLAHARGLPSASRQALADALFAPEFSTRTEVTTTSGRGVGLAAVRTEVERLSGRIEVESEPGRGALFRLRLSSEALGVQTGATETKRRPSVPPSADQRWS
jgi:two-component system chemotaxis sensor kinase CheA